MALFHHLGPEARKLREFPTFSEFSDADLQRLIKTAGPSSLPAKWAVIHERTPGDACYILLSGRVAVYVGKEKVAELGPGEVIGEVALRQKKLRTATVSTLEAAELLHIERDDLDRQLRQIPALGKAIDATVSRHMGEPTAEQ